MIQKNRRKGKRGIEATPVPLGCWAIGGPFVRINDCGDIDDAQSLKTIHRSVDAGIRFFLIG